MLFDSPVKQIGGALVFGLLLGGVFSEPPDRDSGPQKEAVQVFSQRILTPEQTG